MALVSTTNRITTSLDQSSQAETSNPHPDFANSESTGAGNTLGAAGATAVGQGNTVTGVDGVAVGRGNTVTHDGAVVIGAGLSSSAINRWTIGKEIDLVANKAINVLDPTAAQDAATKAYVDNPQRRFFEAMPSRMLVQSDFTGRAGEAQGVVLVPAGAGAGNIGAANFDKTNHPGVWNLGTGTTATGRVFIIGQNTASLHAGVGGITRVGTWLYIAGLSTALEEFVARAGLFSIALPNTILEGIGFEYQFDQNGGRWQGITNATGESSLDTGITVTTGTWYLLEFEINAAGTSVEFFIDKVSVGTLAVAANIPRGITFNLFYNTHIMKLAGTTARSIVIDAYYIYQELTR